MQNLSFLYHVARLILTLSAKVGDHISSILTKIMELPLTLSTGGVAISTDLGAVLAFSRLDLSDGALDAVFVHVGNRRNVMFVLFKTGMIEVLLVDSRGASAAPAIAFASHLSTLQALVVEQTLFHATVRLETNLAGGYYVGLVVIIAYRVGDRELSGLAELRQGEQVIYEWLVFLERDGDLAVFEQIQEFSRSEDE